MVEGNKPLQKPKQENAGRRTNKARGRKQGTPAIGLNSRATACARMIERKKKKNVNDGKKKKKKKNHTSAVGSTQQRVESVGKDAGKKVQEKRQARKEASILSA